MLHTITISETVFNLLNKEARRNRLSPNDLAERLLAERLSADQQAWRTQFEGLLARIHDRMAKFNPTEIESDITATSAEVKAEHRASQLYPRVPRSG